MRKMTFLKTVLFIGGDLRSYKNCYESLYKNVVIPLKCDIYLKNISESIKYDT